MCVLALLTAAYPALVFLAGVEVPPLVFILSACALLVTRGLLGPRLWGASLRWPIVVAIGLIGVLTLLDDSTAAKAYPVVISGGLALLFARSLRTDMSLVERFAAASGDKLTVHGRRYCRRVTLVWAAWLTLNALVAAILALIGSVGAWALWTGLISYLVMGFIFVTEYAIRRLHRQRYAAG